MPERRTLMYAGADMQGPDALGPDGWQRGLMPLAIRGPLVLHYASVVNLPEKCRTFAICRLIYWIFLVDVHL